MDVGLRAWSRAAVLLALVLSGTASAVDPLWLRFYDGLDSTQFNRAAELVTDPGGNVLVCGSGEHDYPGRSDMLLVKYTAEGELLWAAARGGNTDSQDDMAYGVAVDSAGNSYMAGVTFNLDSCGQDATVAMCDRAGVLTWPGGSRKTRWRGADAAYDVAVGRHGDLYVCGSERRDLSGLGLSAFMVMRMDTAQGDIVWERSLLLDSSFGRAPGVDLYPWLLDDWYGLDNCAVAMAIGADGNPVVVGFGWQWDLGYSGWVVKFDTAGSILWQRVLRRCADYGDNAAFDVAVGPRGGYYVCGTAGDTFDFSAPAAWRIDADGQMTREYYLAGDDCFDGQATALAVAPGPDSELLVTGTCDDTSGWYECFAQRLSKDLEPKWGERGARVRGSGEAAGYDIACSATHAYVAGVIDDELTLLRYATADTVAVAPDWIYGYHWPGRFDDCGTCVAVQDDEHVYLGGESYRTRQSASLYVARFWDTAGAVAEKPATPVNVVLRCPSRVVARGSLLNIESLRDGRLCADLYDAAGGLVRSANADRVVALPTVGLAAGVYVARVLVGPRRDAVLLKFTLY